MSDHVVFSTLSLMQSKALATCQHPVLGFSSFQNHKPKSSLFSVTAKVFVTAIEWAKIMGKLESSLGVVFLLFLCMHMWCVHACSCVCMGSH